MKIISIFFFSLVIPVFLFSQAGRPVEDGLDSKTIITTATAFYLKNTSFSKHFITQYAHLTKSFKKHGFPYSKKYHGYRTKDTLQANRQSLILNKKGQSAFPLLMRARLLWEFNEHMKKEELNKATLCLLSKKDSAFYFYTVGQFYKDSINEILARKLGFVKSDNQGNELVDWKKMNHIKITKWALEDITPGINRIDLTIKDIETIFIPLFEKAVEFDRNDFFYMIELLLPLIRFEDEKVVQQFINKYKRNYSRKEQKWLEDRMAESKKRELITNHPKIESSH